MAGALVAAGPSVLFGATAARFEPSADEVLFARDLRVGEEGTVTVDVDDMSVELRLGPSPRLQIVAVGDDIDRARELFERHNLSVVDSAGGVLITAPRARYSSTEDWLAFRDVEVVVVLTLPAGLSTNVTTEDGAIRSEAFEGNASLRTVDGPITVGEFRGSRISLRTSDAPIRARSLIADSLSLSSSDGGIRARVDARVATLRNAAGAIDLDVLGGTSVDVYSHSGSVALALPPNQGATLDLHAAAIDYDWNPRLDFMTSTRATGEVYGGGAPVRVRAPRGVVWVRNAAQEGGR